MTVILYLSPKVNVVIWSLSYGQQSDTIHKCDFLRHVGKWHMFNDVISTIIKGQLDIVILFYI